VSRLSHDKIAAEERSSTTVIYLEGRMSCHGGNGLARSEDKKSAAGLEIASNSFGLAGWLIVDHFLTLILFLGISPLFLSMGIFWDH
jgi:hypothetical protein